MLDVPRHESRRAAERGALRLDVEPQLRRTPGTRRSHPPDESANGGGRRRSGPDRGRPEMGEGARRAMMEPFVRHTGRLAALARANVDTDQIVPKQFLKRGERTGFGPALFHDWRFRPDGTPNPDFELNHPVTRGASILLVGENFCCGSSRAHAVWAVPEGGFPRTVRTSLPGVLFANL